MKLGIMIEGQEGIGWQEWRDCVRWTEELGFESLWRSDHFFSLGGGPRTRDALETWVSLTYAAEHSRRIRFGPLVCSMTFRHPALLARMAAAVDQLSEGRLVLGVGAGWNVPEHEAYGIELPPLKPRLDALEEGVQVLRALFDSEPASFKGRVFNLQDAFLNPKPSQSPLPLLVGGSGEKRTLRIVARYADEWNAVGLSPERYREKVDVLAAHCEREQRDPATVQRSVMCSYITALTEAEVEKKVQERQARLPAGRSVRDAGILVGTPPQIVEQVMALEELGVSRIMLQHMTPPTFEQLQLLAEEIMPLV